MGDGVSRALRLRAEALERFPRWAKLRNHHASALAQAGWPGDALHHLVLAAALDPHEAHTLPRRLVSFCSIVGPKTAFEAAEAYPHDPDPALSAAIRVCFAAGRLLLGPGFDMPTRVLEHMDRHLLPRLDLEKAHADVQLALGRYPSWLILRTFRGLLRLRLGYALSGRRDLETALLVTRSVRHSDGLHLVASILASSDQNGELALLEEAAALGARHRDRWAAEWAFDSLKGQPRFSKLTTREK